MNYEEIDDVLDELSQAFLNVGLEYLDDQLISDDQDKTEILLEVGVEFLARLLLAYTVMNPLADTSSKLDDVLEELKLRSFQPDKIQSQMVN